MTSVGEDAYLSKSYGELAIDQTSGLPVLPVHEESILNRTLLGIRHHHHHWHEKGYLRAAAILVSI